MDLLIFGELIVSNDYYILLVKTFSLFVPYTGLGIYIQGVPTAPSIDFYWGTNAGIRVIPLLTFLMILQKSSIAKSILPTCGT